MNATIKLTFLCLMLCGFILPLAASFPGNCLYFEAGDYVTGTGISTSLSSLTLECWVKHDAVPTSIQRYITLKGESAVLRAESGGVLKFYIKQSNGSLASVSATVITAGEWLHVAGTYDGTTLNLYFNSVLVGTVTASTGGLSGLTGEFDIAGSGESMHGYIDDIRVWSVVRTQAQIKSYRFAEVSTGSTGLINYWKLNESSGSTATDAKGTATGILHNMTDTNWKASDIPVVSKTAGNALRFDYSNSNYVLLNQRSKLPIYNNGLGNAYSVSMWVKPNSHGGYLYSERDSNAASATGFSIDVTGLGYVDVKVYNAGTYVLNGISNKKINDGEWHHLAWVDNNGAGALYIDGIQDTGNFNYTRIAMTLNNSTIGALVNSSGPAGFFDGRIDELCLWRHILTPSLINQYMNGISSPFTASDLISMYQFNESTGNIVYDAISGNNGTMINMSDANRETSTARIGTTASGTITSNTTWSGSAIYINGDVTVNDGVTLTISSGMTVFFSGCYCIYVQGKVTAVGTEQDSIKFTALASNPWHGFRFLSTPSTNDNSRFTYCSFTNAYGGTTSPEYNGSAMYVLGFDKVIITHCSFRDNSNPAEVSNGGGGAIALTNADISISYSEFINNECGNIGGAISLSQSAASIVGCSFSGNTAQNDGGAIYLWSDSPSIVNCIFTGNSTQTKGGAVCTYATSYTTNARITNCIFTGNTSDTNGGAISLAGNYYDVSSVINCLIQDNEATTGGGLDISYAQYKTIQNTIIWGNEADNGDQVGIRNSSALKFYYCDVEGDLSGFYFSGPTLTSDYIHCFSLDPLISYSTSNPGSGYTISNISPCLNAGDPDTELSGSELYDINGNARFFNNTYYSGNLNNVLDRIDVGVIEDQGSMPIIPDGTVVDRTQVILDDLYLYPGRTMSVNPGIELSFLDNVRAIIYGNLNAIGTPYNPITFTDANSGNHWMGFTFYTNTTYPDQQSHFKNCNILRGNIGTGNEAWGGCIHLWYYNYLLLENCTISEGLAEVGGAIYARGSHLDMYNCVINNNVCTARGTGVYCNGTIANIINCTFAGNSKTGDQSTPAYLAVLYFNNVTVQPKVRNCIFWDNGSSPLYLENGTFTDLTYCDVEGGYEGEGNIDIDPSFTGEDHNPFIIAKWSFCINAGIPDTTGLGLPVYDMLNHSRVYAHQNSIYDRIDMGAYEYQGLLCPGNFTASDGNNDYPGYVHLEWTYNLDYNITVNGYKVYRNNILYETISNEIFAYSDYNVSPGTIYIYYVQAYYNVESGNSDEDGGYIKPNGIISGNIKTSNSNPVMGVKVSLTPSVGYCLHLNSANASVINIPNPNANMNADFTLELWVNTTNHSVTIFNSGTHTLSITSSGLVKYTDGMHILTQADTSVNVTDADWHHIAIVNDFSNNQVRMYLDEIIAASTTEYVLGNYTPAAFTIPSGLTGYVDDLRIWEVARDSSEVVDEMEIVVAYNATGLKGYWAMNEGTGTSIYDATNNSANGIQSNCNWSSADPDIALGAVTDAWGDYVITQIPYGSATTFSVVPTKTGHIFQPEQRLITLSSSNIAADNVTFTDNSMIPITGYVKFQGTIVPVVGAVICLNGSPALPRVTTDGDGYYVLEVEHGTESIVSVDYNEHPFNRSWNLGSVTYPRPNINFEDIFRTEFALQVVGGTDSYPIGDFDVALHSVDGLYTKEINGQSWPSGQIMVPNIPPLEYNVTVNPGTADPFALVIDDQFQSMKTQYLDMRDPGETLDTLRYEWRASLQIEVAWDDSLSLKQFAEYPGKYFRVLTQNEWYSVIITAFEDYSYSGHPNQVTYLNDCDININDQVGTKGEQSLAFDGETEFEYSFAPYLPNILSGFDRQYQNMLEITVRDEPSNRFATQTDWIITQGVKPMESTYATTSPQIPLLILHDPPGDGSQVTFNQSHTHTTTMSTSVAGTEEAEVNFTVHMGPDFNFSGGTPFFSTETDIDITNDFTENWTVESKQTNSWEEKLTFTTTSELATSSSSDIVGDAGADVFMGAAVNLIWGVTKELYWDYDDEVINEKSGLMVNTNGFDTQYIYTESQITNSVIPNLIAIGDTTSVAMWQDYLEMNNDNKTNAVEDDNYPDNISFCAGPSYTLSASSSKTKSKKFEWEVTVSAEFGFQIGEVVNGVGCEGGFKFKAGINVGQSSQSEDEDVTTTTILLADDDVASDLTFNSDYFTVDIKKDPQYGTPVFNLISGASSSHWEPNTQPRDGVMMSANTYTASNIPAGQAAAFLLYLSNTSQTNEPRRYYLEVMHSTNTMGATVKINGVALANRMAFDFDGGETVTAVLTVEPGLIGYELEGLILEFYAEGDRGYEGPVGHFFDIYRSFNVYWEAPYSRVTIMSPQDNWLVNQACDDTLHVMFRDYDLSKSDFRSIKLQYKHPADADWLPALEVFRDVLEENPFYISVPWDVGSLSDGIYEIRAATTDSVHADYYTGSLVGTIDRASPEVLGLPQPADGIMQLGDEIYLRFNEDIDPSSILPGCVTMEVVGDLLVVDTEVQCYGNIVTIVPRIVNFWLENQTFKVTVQNLTDLHGNPMAEPVEWEFYVNSNPVYWQTSKIELIKPLGNTMSFTSKLINSGGQQSSFTIEELPSWLTATPMSGILLPLDDETISFTISSQIGFGTYRDTLYANIPSLGMEALVVEVSVLADPPTWTSDLSYNYDHTMTIVGQMLIDAESSTDLNDVIGAFIQNGSGGYECRGVAHTEYVDYQGGSYLFYLTVHSDEEYGEPIEFRIWDASQCKEHYGILENYVFSDGANFGSIVTPDPIHASDQLIRDISLATGWTWISTNLLNTGNMDVNSVLSSLNPTPNDLIKNQTQYAQYTAGSGWLGSLNSISTDKMYKLKLASADNLTLVGELEDPDATEISYATGWNWISYIPHVSISVGEALGNIYNLATGDMLKSQRAFAQYLDGYGWVGSLRFLNPGEGYLLKTANSGTFTYPDYHITRSWKARHETESLPRIAGWELNPNSYEFSANLTSVLQLNGISASSDYVIGAFVGDECRGIAEAIEVLGTPMYFLTMYSNTYNETLGFKVYDAVSQSIYDLSNTLTFINNQVTGSPSDPYLFQLQTYQVTAPQNLQLLRSADSVTLSWNPVPNALTYRVYTCQDPSATDPQWSLAATNLSSPQWVDHDLSVRKFYRVAAVFNDLRGSSFTPQPVETGDKPSSSKPIPKRQVPTNSGLGKAHP
jgi:hypothetical protein